MTTLAEPLPLHIMQPAAGQPVTLLRLILIGDGAVPLAATPGR